MDKLYISRKEAMHALMCEANTHSNPVKRAYTRAAAIIEQITVEDVQPVDRWISVKDKLPEVGKVVIVCDKQGGVGAMELLSNGQWYHRGMAWSAEWILYWQPLPEPPTLE